MAADGKGYVSHGASRVVRKKAGWRSRKALKRIDLALARHDVLVQDGWRCQYCGRRATTVDHIIPKADRRRMKVKADDEAYLVAACARCNLRKGTRRLVPPMWAGRIADLQDWSGKRWSVWDGGKLPEVLR